MDMIQTTIDELKAKIDSFWDEYHLLDGRGFPVNRDVAQAYVKGLRKAIDILIEKLNELKNGR